MKHYFYFTIVLFIFLVSCVQPDNQSKIILETTGYPDSTIIYLMDVERETTIDTGYIINNHLEFLVKIDSPTRFLINPVIKKREDIDYKYFWKEDKRITIWAEKGGLKNARIEGSEIQKQADVLAQSKARLEKKRDSLRDVYVSMQGEDRETLMALRIEKDKITEQIRETEINYVNDHPDYLTSAVTLTFLMRQLPKEQTEELYENLTQEMQSTRYGLTVKKYLDLSRDVTIGDKAIDFQLPDLDGHQISLDHFKNKLVLLEFWSSGCGPCRMENPNLLKNYLAYKERGFEIFGVSLDKRRESWENAVEKDSMLWTTVSDLKGFNGDVAITYRVYFIPKNYLIDTNGVVIAEDLRGEQLSVKLEELFR